MRGISKVFLIAPAGLAVCLVAAPLSLANGQTQAQIQEEPQIDYDGFFALTKEVRDYRAKRLISLEKFNAYSALKDTLILDTRSAKSFAAGHIEGAVNLPFSDFTAEKLAKVIGKDKQRTILIYCNNNFSNNAFPIALKNPLLALNIPTFINLYGYGYRNILELEGSYFLANPDIAWTGERPPAIEAQIENTQRQSAQLENVQSQSALR